MVDLSTLDIVSLTFIGGFYHFAPTGPSPLLLSGFPVWVWQPLACSCHITNYDSVSLGADTSLVVPGNLGKHWQMAHQSDFGLPSAASLNCLLSPLHQELRAYISTIITVHPVSHSTFIGNQFN